MSFKSCLAGYVVLLVCTLGGYFMEKEGYIKHPAHFVTWGYVFGLMAAGAMWVYR